MSTSNNYSLFTILFTLLATTYMCSCTPSELGLNATLAGVGFSSAVATWYGSPTGAGSGTYYSIFSISCSKIYFFFWLINVYFVVVGGACGFENDVQNAPYYGMISAGNSRIFRSGAGCGTCYTVI